MAPSPLRDIPIRRPRQRPSFSARALATDALPLPAVKPPPLDGIRLEVPEVGDEEISARVFANLLRAAERKPRREGEPIQRGDAVAADLLFYARGAPVPFGAWLEHRFLLEPSRWLPTLHEQLLGVPVGTGRRDVELRLSDDYPVTSLRGANVLVLVDIRSSEQVLLPDKPSPLAIDKAERATVEELANAACAELLAQLFDHLAARVEEPLAEELLDAEILRRFGAQQLEGLAQLGLDQDELQAAAQAQLEDPLTRALAERRLLATLALAAFAKQEGLSPSPALLQLVFDAAGLPANSSEELLRRVPAVTGTRPYARNAAAALAVVERLVRRVEIHKP